MALVSWARGSYRIGGDLRRREFVTLLGGASMAWPLDARAQRPVKVPKVGFLFPGSATAAPSRIASLLDGLHATGYSEPEQVKLIPRMTDGDPARIAPL